MGESAMLMNSCSRAVRSVGTFRAFSSTVRPATTTVTFKHADMEYEDYTHTSTTYDSVRAPIGLNSLRSAFGMASANLAVPVENMRVLDVGCGTGNYIDAIKDSVGSCDGLEFNPGMLKQ